MTEPAPYRVELAPAAQRQLRRLPPGDAARLRAPMLGLADDPRPRGSVPITGTTYLRLRVGDLRVVYLVDDREPLIIVLQVARRSESTYRRIE